MPENEKFLLKPFWKLIQNVEADITKVEFVTPTFAGVKQRNQHHYYVELEYKNSSNKKGLKMTFDEFLESNRRLEGGMLQVAVTELIESFKSVTPPF